MQAAAAYICSPGDVLLVSSSIVDTLFLVNCWKSSKFVGNQRTCQQDTGPEIYLLVYSSGSRVSLSLSFLSPKSRESALCFFLPLLCFGSLSRIHAVLVCVNPSLDRRGCMILYSSEYMRNKCCMHIIRIVCTNGSVCLLV